MIMEYEIMKSTFLLLLCAAMCVPAVVAQIDRSKAPASQPTPSISLPRIQRATLTNGLTVMVVEHHELPIIQLRLILQSGAALDPSDKAGTANLTAQMVREGTKHRTSLQIADEFDFLGANFFISSSADATVASVQTLKEHLAKTLDVFADVVLHPSFPQSEWDRVKQQHLTGLLQQKDRPATVANNAFASLLYGTSHPYGRPEDGTETSVRAISLEDLKHFYTTHYVPANATVIVVGDITLTETTSLLEKYFGNWKGGAAPAAQFPAVAPIDLTKIFLVDKPKAAQSEIRIGHLGTKRNGEDYYALAVMNMILGGQFSSRINLNLREAKGYTYGARSGFTWKKEIGSFIASSAVKTAITDSAVIEFMKELRRMRDEDVTPAELELAKNGIVRYQPQGFETPMQIAQQLSTLVLFGLPDSYFDGLVQNIERVSAADVRRVAQKYLNPTASKIVIVGDLSIIRPGLEGLGYGTTTVVDAEGNAVH
jgi:predicted Zn-dependent peptidase